MNVHGYSMVQHSSAGILNLVFKHSIKLAKYIE